MKTRNTRKLMKGIAGALLLIAPLLISAQQYTASSESEMVVKGTSTLHDWHSEVKSIKSEGTVEVDNGQLKSIESLQVQIPVKSIKSGKSTMDNLTYDALKADDHPEIQFTVKAVQSIDAGTIKATGSLTIAGVTRTVQLPATYTVAGNLVKIKGKHNINMTDYNIDPPTAMFGTVKAGENVTIEYTLVLAK